MHQRLLADDPVGDERSGALKRHHAGAQMLVEDIPMPIHHGGAIHLAESLTDPALHRTMNGPSQYRSTSLSGRTKRRPPKSRVAVSSPSATTVAYRRSP